jgi:protoporphyrinogen oxidase
MVDRVAVIGAGPAGLTAAYALSKKNISVDVFEAGTTVGGMARTIFLWGQLVDLGPHRFFSTDPRVNRLWLEIVGYDYRMVNRLTRIYYEGRFFHYPLKPLDALLGLGIAESIRCLSSYAAARLFPPPDTSTFEDWVISRFGRRLFDIFFKSYSEKLWGISCRDIDSDFAAQRIKKFSLSEAVMAAFRGGSGSRHKTLVDEFAYPKLGTGMVYDRMANALRERGGRVYLNCPIEAVLPAGSDEGKPQLRLPDGSLKSYDHVVSTMPITVLVERMQAPEEILQHARGLRFRNTVLVYLRVASANPFPDQWIYVHSPHLRTGRITNFRNWVATLAQGQDDTILCLEFWCNDDDRLWAEEDQVLIKLAADEIHHTRLVPLGKVIDGHVMRIPKCYPVYARGYKSHLKPVEDFLSRQRGLTAIGRYGAFKYNNQDHSILMGLLAAENLTLGAGHNLWALNTNYEYQEATLISDTGLAQA